MKILDLFCGAGGCAVGYHQSGLFTEITGVDINPQPRYPFNFIQADALEYLRRHWQDYDIIHASPPCQAYSVTKSLTIKEHPDLVEQTRELLADSGKPYIIENVPGAPLINPLMLCGSMFGLKVKRHRLFEIWPNQIYFTPPCSCSRFFTHSGKGQFSSFANGANAICVAGHNFCVDDGRAAMGIDWMSGKELSQAIPPAYTRFIASHL